MSTNNTKKLLKEIKSTDFSQWSISFWLVKRKILQKEAAYNVLRVDIDRKLQRRFLGYLKQQLQTKEFHVDEYDFNNTDSDDALFTIAAETTDFIKIEAAINKCFENPHATEYDQLLNSWGYVVLFENDGKRLYGWKKISSDTRPKTAISKNMVFFQNHKLIDVDERDAFVIYPQYDFFVFEGTTFIANKKNFESSMNFREGMKANGEEVLAAFTKLELFEGVELIRDFVGTNLHHLRKLSSIRKSGYYNQPDYMEKLKKVSKKEKWNLKIVNGKIIVEAETVELLLKLLNNDRLKSPINDELFDAAAKALVANS